MTPKIFIYSGYSDFEKEMPENGNWLFSSGTDRAFRKTDSPENADYFTLPFPLELLSELSGEKQYCKNFLKQLKYINRPEYAKKHFFITGDAFFPGNEFPSCRFFKTCHLPLLAENEQVLPPFSWSAAPIPLSGKSFDFGIITPFSSPLRTKILETHEGGIETVAPCRVMPDTLSERLPNIWYNQLRNKFDIGSGHYAMLAGLHGKASEKILRGCRFVICPLSRFGDYSDVLTAIAAGRVPVIITGETELPWDGKLNFSDCSFIIGNTPGDLLKLHDIAGLGNKEYSAMATRCRKLWEKHYSPRPLQKKVFASLRKPPARTAENLQYDALASDNVVHVLKFFWEYVADRLTDEKKGVAIFGAGKFLAKLFKGLSEAKRSPLISGIADDNEFMHHKVFNGFEIKGLDSFRSSALGGVILATDTYEKQMTARVREFFGENMRIFSLSEFIMENAALVREFQVVSLSAKSSRSDISPDECLFRANYRPGGRLRVKRLEGLTVCVGYADILRWTLPHNIKHFDNFAVVTSINDKATQKLAKQYGARLVVSDSYRDGSAAFNKGKMLNAGIDSLSFDDWCLSIDADIILNSATRDYIFSRSLNEKLLYFTSRHNVPPDQCEQWLEQYLSTGQCPCPPMPAGEPEPYGFFQLFHSDAPAIRKSKVFSEAFENAGGIDFHFAMKWAFSPDCAIAYIPLKTIHVPHGEWGTNWSGRQSKRLAGPEYQTPAISSNSGWKQLAYHSISLVTLVSKLPNTDGFIKYTRSDTGEFIIAPFHPATRNSDRGNLVLGEKSNNLFSCGILSGEPGDVAISVGYDGKEISGWGVGVLPGSSIPARCWNGKLINSIADFDISFKKVLSPEELAQYQKKGLLLSLKPFSG